MRKVITGRLSFVDADAGYQGIDKRSDANPGALWRVAMRPDKRKALDKSQDADVLIDKDEKREAGTKAKVEHPFSIGTSVRDGDTVSGRSGSATVEGILIKTHSAP